MLACPPVATYLANTHTHNVCSTAYGPHLGSEPAGGNKTGDPVASLIFPTAKPPLCSIG